MRQTLFLTDLKLCRPSGRPSGRPSCSSFVHAQVSDGQRANADLRAQVSAMAEEMRRSQAEASNGVVVQVREPAEPPVADILDCTVYIHLASLPAHVSTHSIALLSLSEEGTIS